MLDLEKPQNRTPKNLLKFSKYLSYILRHKPEDIGLKLEEDGWVSVDKLIYNLWAYGDYCVNIEVLQQIVNEDEKGRYSFKGDYEYIRANQGHSIQDLKMNFEEFVPTGDLYHGTSSDGVGKIFESGAIKPMSRQYVHLSKDVATAKKVGSRHDTLYSIVLVIDAKGMYEKGFKFYQSTNGVVLCKEVPTEYVELF